MAPRLILKCKDEKVTLSHLEMKMTWALRWHDSDNHSEFREICYSHYSRTVFLSPLNKIKSTLNSYCTFSYVFYYIMQYSFIYAYSLFKCSLTSTIFYMHTIYYVLVSKCIFYWIIILIHSYLDKLFLH